MQGSVIIAMEKGWSCSNEAEQTIEVTLDRLDNGQRVSRHKSVIRALYYHNVEGEPTVGSFVGVLFKSDEDEQVITHKAKIAAITPEMIILELLQKTDNKQEILKKIKGGYNYGN